MSGPFQWNPFTYFLDRIGQSGGGGGDITLTSQSGTPNLGSAFTIRGMNAGSAPAIFTSNSGSTFSIEDRTWDTPYVVDQSTTPGLRGTYSTIQAALDAAKADGMTFQVPKKILIRFTNSSAPFNEDLNIWSGAYFACDSIGAPVGGAFVVPAIINGNHTCDDIAVFYSQGVNWQAAADTPLFAGGSTVMSMSASDSVISTVFPDGTIFDTAGNFNCYFQNCEFAADSDTTNAFNCSQCSTVIFQSCNFNGMQMTLAGGVPKFYNCQNIGVVTMADQPVIAYDSSFVAQPSGVSCVVQGSGNGCTFVNCRFFGNDGIQYALDAPGAVQAFFSNCTTLGLNYIIKGFVSPGTPVGDALSCFGNVLFGIKIDDDQILSGMENYVGISDSSVPRQITLRQTARDYQVWVCDEDGNAANANITVIDLGGGTINGQSSYAIGENYGGALFRSKDGTDWTVVATANPSLNAITGTATSVNGSTEDLITFALTDVPASYRFSFEIIGRETTTGDTVGYSLEGTVKTDGTDATLVAAPFTDNDEDAALLAATVDLVASANNTILQVTGVTATTIIYKATGKYTVI